MSSTRQASAAYQKGNRVYLRHSYPHRPGFALCAPAGHRPGRFAAAPAACRPAGADHRSNLLHRLGTAAGRGKSHDAAAPLFRGAADARRALPWAAARPDHLSGQLWRLFLPSANDGQCRSGPQHGALHSGLFQPAFGAEPKPKHTRIPLSSPAAAGYIAKQLIYWN